MDREGGYKERMRKFFLHFLILSPFPLRFLFISSFSLHFLAARLQGCNDSCSPDNDHGDEDDGGDSNDDDKLHLCCTDTRSSLIDFQYQRMMVQVLKRPIYNDGETLINGFFKLEMQFAIHKEKITYLAGAHMMTIAC